MSYSLRLQIVFFSLILLSTPATVAHATGRHTPVVDAVHRTAPAVVNIGSEAVETEEHRPFGGAPMDPFFERFFRDFFEGRPSHQVPRTSLGSGVIIDGIKGFILTNAHVIEGAGVITVSLLDERQFEASVVGADPDSDLAVLQIKSPDRLPAVPMGRSNDLMIGETVIAIGNPFGFSHTVTTGVISAIDRSFRSNDRVYRDFIQTDASINPGNSGGPLLNINGELIGINTAIYAKAQGIGFAIPIDKARRIISDLIAHGEVVPAWLGLTVQAMDQRLADYLKQPEKTGVIVVSVTSDSPARRGGIHNGDIIVALNQRPISDPTDYDAALASVSVGDPVTITLQRPTAKVQLRIKAGVFPEKAAPTLVKRMYGLSVADLTSAMAQKYRIVSDSGVVITDLDMKSDLAEYGVRPGDVIRRVDDRPTDSVDAFYKAVIRFRTKPSVVLLVQRGYRGYYITLRHP